jgi:hypothetical protein
MKKIMLFVFAVTAILFCGTAPLFADGNNCNKTFCSSTEIPYQKVKPQQLRSSAATETDPFTILIPGNHF